MQCLGRARSHGSHDALPREDREIPAPRFATSDGWMEKARWSHPTRLVKLEVAAKVTTSVTASVAIVTQRQPNAPLQGATMENMIAETFHILAVRSAR